MSFMKILTNVVKHKISSKVDDTPHIYRTATPTGLHQGSVFVVPDIDFALAKVDGTIVDLPTENQIVSAVGTYSLWGMKIYNSYFKDGKSFIQTIQSVKENRIVECKYWSMRSEILPQTVEEWEFWLGSYKKDNEGQFVRDANGHAVRNEFGLIGWPEFQVDGNTPIIYSRSWNPSDTGIDPVKYTETIVDSSGKSVTVKHEAMEYFRKLTNATDSIKESVLATVVQEGDSGSVNVFVGIPLNHNSLKVLSS